MAKTKFLYHGTLRRHLPSIEANGLMPTVGKFTQDMYGKKAEGVVPAVFMACEKGLERAVHAMVAATMDELTDKDFEAYRIGTDYQTNDDLVIKYGALLVIERSDAFARTGKPKPGTVEPEQAETGDWYSLEAVRPIKVLVGDDLEEFLADRGLTPSDINDFVDPDSERASVNQMNF